MSSQSSSQPGGDVAPDDAVPYESNAMLDRAARELRERPDDGWTDLSERMISVLRATARRSWPLRAQFPPSALPPELERERDTLHVSDQVVISGIRIALRAVEGCAPTRISLRVDGHDCLGADIALAAVYGTDLQAAARQCRALTVATLDDLLGPGRPRAHEVVVDVTVSDVTVEHPRS